jgi:hypothetical protein
MMIIAFILNRCSGALKAQWGPFNREVTKQVVKELNSQMTGLG